LIVSHRIESGSFLIATPTLRDPNFARSIVLLCEHDVDEGSMGLVVNRPSDMTLAETLHRIGPHPRQSLWIGGPVQRDIVLVLHRDATVRGARQVCDGMGLGGEEDDIVELVRSPGPSRVRVFSGYAGWGRGQLAEEFKTGSWISCPASAQFVFDTPPDEMWERVLRSLGPQYAYLTQVPLDPRVN
jgi:putative transcriptional regulator